MTHQVKSYKKFVATAATATLVASAIAPVASAASFTDVSANYKNAVDYLVENNITQGLTATKFGTQDNLTRKDAAIWLAKALELDVDNAPESGFTDVPERSRKAVNALKHAGYVQGKSDTSFGADDSLKRGEMALILAKAYDLKGDGATLKFTDVSSRYSDAVKAMVANEITQGKSTTSFGTDDLIKRGEMAIFMYKAENLYAEPEVVSVSAVNANEIKIEFNNELDKTTAETVTNYTLNNVAFVAGQDKAVLQKDKKSVVIKLGASGVVTGGLLSHNTAYEITASTNITDTKGNKLSDENRSKTLLFKDAVKPTVSSVTTDESGDVTVTFSERLKTSVVPTIVINEVTVTPANITVNDDGTVSVSNVDPALSGLTVNKTYTIVVSGAQDLLGNVMNLHSQSFNYSVINEEPTVVSVAADGEKSIEVKFDEALSANLVNGTTVKVYKGASLIAATPVSSDNKTFNLNLNYADVYGAGENSALIRVVFEGYKDAQGNVGHKYETNVTLTKDTVKPVIESTSFDGSTDILTVNFSEGLSAVTAANYAPNLYVTDVNGVRYDVSTSDTAATELLTLVDVNAGDETITFNASEFANGTYYLTLQAGAFKDQANTPNANAAQTVTFTVGNSSDTTKPTVSTVSEVTKGQFNVVFSEPVKGGNVAGSATSYTNYQINGATLPAGTTIFLDQTKTIATITLPEGTVPNTGVKLVTVSNVQDLAGNVLATDTKTATLTDNTKPVLKTASVNASNQLVLEFSEAFASAPTATDVEVSVNGTAIPAGSLVVNVDPSNAKKYIVTATGYNFATGNIVVKTLDDSTLPADAAGNTLVVGTTLTATR